MKKRQAYLVTTHVTQDDSERGLAQRLLGPRFIKSHEVQKCTIIASRADDGLLGSDEVLYLVELPDGSERLVDGVDVFFEDDEPHCNTGCRAAKCAGTKR